MLIRHIAWQVFERVGDGTATAAVLAQSLMHAGMRYIVAGGNPVSVAIAERDPSLLPVITTAVADALQKHFGGSMFRAPMRAIVVQARA